MQEDYSVYKVPSFAKESAYNFEVSSEDTGIYEELSAISEEIEKCRLRNC